MCGIAGIVDFEKHDPHESLLLDMLGYIRHRGPDAFGIYEDDLAGLASSRLSIIDLAGGDQPIANETGTIWVVYNGEIFNYPEIRSDLLRRGHVFRTGTDTEVLVHLYEEHGARFLPLLNGQFAFALWDQTTGKLVLGRDRLGVRPLFYYEDRGKIVFGSEIKAVFADRRIPKRIDPGTLSDIFTCWAPLGEKTAFSGIHQLLPGHYLEFSRKGKSEYRYWQLPGESGGDDRPRAQYMKDLEELLYDAVKIRLRADVPVGAYLSGGLDSTLITSIVKRHFNNRLCTFSVTFSDGRFDEEPFQRQAVDRIGSDHRTIRCVEEDIGKVFPSVIWHTETPILRTAPAPLFMLSEMVRENGFKVVLTGEGADEIFAGYDLFKEDKIRRFWAQEPSSSWRPALFRRIYPDIFSEVTPGLARFHREFFKRGLLDTRSEYYSHRIRWENTSRLKSFFSDDLKRLDPDLSLSTMGDRFLNRFISGLPPEFSNWNPLSRAQYNEISIFLSNYLLSSQGDRMGMAHAVEGRYPFLDHRVVEFAFRLPAAYKLSALKDKFILRRTALNYLPEDLAFRPKKPYRAPISRCFFCNPGVSYPDALLSESEIKRTGYFDFRKVKALTDKCRKKDGMLVSERENMAVMGLLSTQLLESLFIRNFPLPVPPAPEELKRISRRYSESGKTV